MSTPPKKLSSFKKRDKSDVLSLLLSIEGIYTACQNVLNTYTQITLMLSVAIEAQMLVRKLRVMHDRWASHLPFKEACTVDFYDWSKKVEKMSLSLVNSEDLHDNSEKLSEYCPSKHFVLDLYEMLPDKSLSVSSPFYREANIDSFISTQDKIRKDMKKHWADYLFQFSELIVNDVENRIGKVLHPLSDKSIVIRMACSEVLQQLSEALLQLHEMPKGVIQRDQFARLAERVINEQEYGGHKAKDNALRDVNYLKDVTPEEQWPERCDDEIKASIDFINELKFGRRVFEFIGYQNDITSSYSGLGRFLNSVRRDISEEELLDLMEQLYRLHFLYEDKKQRVAALAASQEVGQAIGEVQAMENDKKRKPAKSAQAKYELRRNIKPERPSLPLFFNTTLASNDDAIKTFYDLFHRCGFYIGRALLDWEKKDKTALSYANWKWKHVRQAFMDLCIIQKDTTKKGFAVYLEQVFPYLDAESIKRDFNSRNNIYEDTIAFNRIVREIRAEFQPVADLIA